MDDSDDGTYDYSYSEEDSDDGMSNKGYGSHTDMQASRRKVKYTIFNEEKLKERQSEIVEQTASLLGIPEPEAVRILRIYKWDPNLLNEDWWNDTDAVRSKAGLIDSQSVPSTSTGPSTSKSKKAAKVQCQICFDSFSPDAMCSASCAHVFCKNCYRAYVLVAIGNGPTALDLRCPMPECNAAVPVEVIMEVSDVQDQEKYARFALRSYVEDNDSLEWCPAPNCEHAAESHMDLAGEPLDVMCSCGTCFCFSCKEEAHRPVDCGTVKKWMIKNSAESENLNWILANTKGCPKCKRPIEKNQGCMHMTCSQCKFGFCWLCLAPWEEHNERTGGFYACNRYEAAKGKGEYDEEAQKRENAKHALERYMHYYQRWAENDKSRKEALVKMKQAQSHILEKLSTLYTTPTSQLKFILDAWSQVVDCRRILKWTYAFGFYNFDESVIGNQTELSPEKLKQQQEFFEFNQGQSEHYLEMLHGIAEKELQEKVESPVSEEDWAKFREKLIGLTDVTKSHFDKLVQELEKGMEKMLVDYNELGEEMDMEMEIEEPDVEPERKSEEAGRSKGKHKEAKHRASPRASSKRTRAAQRSAGESSADGQDLLMMDSDAEESAGFWQCRSCTFANTDLSAEACEICDASRVRRSS